MMDRRQLLGTPNAMRLGRRMLSSGFDVPLARRRCRRPPVPARPIQLLPRGFAEPSNSSSAYPTRVQVVPSQVQTIFERPVPKEGVPPNTTITPWAASYVMLGPNMKSPEIDTGDVAGFSLLHEVPFPVHVSLKCGAVIVPSNRSPLSSTRLAA